MQEYVGLWIDSDRAIIVTLLGDEHSVMTQKSHVDAIRQPAAAAVSDKAGDSVDAANDPAGAEERSRRLQAFYANVLSSIGDPCRILILGPGDAKKDLERLVRERSELAARLGAVEDAGEMSGAEIARRTRALFEGC